MTEEDTLDIPRRTMFATTSARPTPTPTPTMRCASRHAASRRAARVVGVVVTAASARDDQRRLQQLVETDGIRAATGGGAKKYVARESGDKRGERLITGFWQTFAEKASDARKRHFDGRKTIDSKEK